MIPPLRQTIGELPAFEERAPDAAHAAGWHSRPEAGTVFGMRILERIAVLLGRRALHLALFPVTVYFLVVRGAERRASRRFLTRIGGRPATLGQVFEHFLTFARMSADRFLFLTGRDGGIDVCYHGLDAVRRLVEEGRGGIFLGSHIGSFEAARTIAARQPSLVMRIVLDSAVNSKLVGRLAALNPQFAASVIDPEQPAAGFGLKVAEALRDGHWVGFLADRYRPGARNVTCGFLGGRAKFPVGPFLIAAAFRSPVVCVFPLYVKGRYEVHFEIMSESLTVPREGREALLRAHIQSYADRLAAHVRNAPCNWFNFYDFWAD